MREASHGVAIAVVMGMAGSLLLGLGATSRFFAHDPAGWRWETLTVVADHIGPLAAVALTAVGTILLIAGWWSVRPRGERAVANAPFTLALWSLPLLVLPPVLTADPFAYSDAGWILLGGDNPYAVGLGHRDGPFAAAVDPRWRGGSMAWPPLSVVVSAIAVHLTGAHPYWGVVAQRGVALVGVVLTAVALPRIAERIGARRAQAEWLGLLSPLVVIHYVGGAHVDSLAVGVAVAALWVSLVGRPRQVLPFAVAAALVGVAMALKQYTGLAVVAVAGVPLLPELRAAARWRATWILGWRTAIATLIALAVFWGTSAATGLGLGWSTEVGQWYDIVGSDYPIGRAVTLTPSFFVGDVLTRAAALAGFETLWFYQIAVFGVAGAGFVALAWLLVGRSHDPVAIVGWGSLIVAGAAQTLHPWYLGLGLAFLGLLREPGKAVTGLSVALCGYLMGYLMGGALWAGLAVAVLTCAALAIANRADQESPPVDGYVSSAARPQG